MTQGSYDRWQDRNCVCGNPPDRYCGCGNCSRCCVCSDKMRKRRAHSPVYDKGYTVSSKITDPDSLRRAMREV